MPPKNKQGPEHAVINRELLQRANFLYQASCYLQGKDDTLARTHVQSMKTISNKAIVKLDPSVKRSICKGCNAVLVPGSTATVRVKRSRQHAHRIVTTCMQCKTSRSIPHPPEQPAPSPEPPTESHTSPLAGSQPSITDSGSKNASMQSRRRRRHRPLPFSEREGHILLCGHDVVQRPSPAAFKT